MDEKRPKLDLPLSPLEKVIEILSVFGLIGICCYLFMKWPNLPDQINTHFNAMGVADDTGGKSTLLMMPIGTACLYALLTITARFPQTFNLPKPVTEQNAEYMYRNARLMLAFLKIEIIIGFSYIEYCMVQSAVKSSFGLGTWFLPVFLGGVFATTGYFIYKLSREK